MTVAENLLFGLPRHLGDRRGLMREGLHQIDLAGFEDRPPHSLSGGQRSRVALMRALLARPAAMLLDEPFSKLDAELRGTIRAMVFGLIRQRGIPCLLVSHDRADAPGEGRILHLTSDGEGRHA